MTSILFDHEGGIEHPAGDGLTIGLLARQDALFELAKHVRRYELAELSTGDRWTGIPCPYPFVYGAFGWFATSLTAYLQLVPIADRLRGNAALLHRLAIDRSKVKAIGQEFVDGICPEVRAWRNQVGAHAAIADPRKDDNLALLLASITYSVSARNQRFFVGDSGHAVIASGSSTPIATHVWTPWSITETFEKLAPRFWPDRHLD